MNGSIEGAKHIINDIMGELGKREVKKIIASIIPSKMYFILPRFPSIYLNLLSEVEKQTKVP